MVYEWNLSIQRRRAEGEKMLSRKIARELLKCSDGENDIWYVPMGTIRALATVIEREDRNSNYRGTPSLNHLGRVIQAEARRVLAKEKKK